MHACASFKAIWCLCYHSEAGSADRLFLASKLCHLLGWSAEPGKEGRVDCVYECMSRVVVYVIVARPAVQTYCF
ncbi:hypothetical protein BJX66DRAFT_296597 [Aspergillus keveii]|uniref:Secreted protein n=1 Tax=Aspergillus keveii TaxID=714993 RepID=A0ABR4GGI1_9EURO